MNKVWQRGTSFVILLALVLIFGFSRPILAKVVASFSDVQGVPWAQKYIVRMKIRGIVSGYEDGTFKPNQTIKQAEALIMAVRELGWESEAQGLINSANLSLPKKIALQNIPSFARGYVAVAVRSGLIDADGGNFQWANPATRAWTCQLIVRMLGKDEEAKAAAQRQMTFTDNSAIPAWARGYIYVAQNLGIVTGYPDQTFQPNLPMTRAEMVTVLSRAEQYLNVTNYVVAGTVENVYTNRLTVRDGSGRVSSYNLADGGWVFIGDRRGTLSDLWTGDPVRLILVSPEEAGMVEAYAASGQSRTKFSGQVVLVNQGQQIITLRNSAGELKIYSVPSSVEVVSTDGRRLGLSALQPGDEVEVWVDNYQVVKLISSRTISNVITARVISINHDEDVITVRTNEGELIAAYVTSRTAIQVDGDDGELSDIDIGDTVELTLDGQRVLTLEVGDNDINTVKGEVVRVDTSNWTLRLEDQDGDRTTYDVDRDVDIEIPGYSHPDLSDIEVGDQVSVRLRGDKIVEIRVNSDDEDEIVQVTRVDEDNYTLRVKDIDGDYTTYDVERDVNIEIEGHSNPGLDDVNVGDWVKIRLDSRNNITRIVVGEVVEGKVVTVYEDEERIRIEKTSGTRQTYDVSKNAKITYNSKSYDLEDIDSDDEVQLIIFDDVVEKIIITERN
ncbi:MAG: S-layer homology domain-containing protein [Firmicutes bacterium]|nr:S-layer homology domain-containing protein [Bacillota bacterium]